MPSAALLQLLYFESPSLEKWFSSQINGCINYLVLGNNGTIDGGKQQARCGDRVLSRLISAAAGAELPGFLTKTKRL